MSLLGFAEVVILLIDICFRICQKSWTPLTTIREINETNYDEKIQRMAGIIEVSNSDVFI